MPLYQALAPDLSQKIQKFLGTSNRKGGDHHISTLVKGFLQNLCQSGDIILSFRIMKPVTIGGLYQYVIGLFHGAWVLYEGLVYISHISGKNDLL